jgi:hypothetical protein
MLGAVVLRDVVLASLRYDSRPYILVWEYTAPVLLFFQVNAALQALRSVARLYPRAGNFAVRLFLLCLALAIAACCLGLPFELRHFSTEEAFLRTAFLMQRLVDSTIAGTLILVDLFLICYPAPPKQPPFNIVLHTILLSLYFGGYAALFFLENLVPLGSVQTAERLQFSLVVLVYLTWARCLSSEGQRSHAWPDVEVILLDQVEVAR